MTHTYRSNGFRRGTTLIELLVVMVIFLVGILAIIQIFPKGLAILNQTRNKTIENQLVRSEIERLKGNAESLPSMILPVNFVQSGGLVNLVADPDRNPNDLAPAGTQLMANGDVIKANGENIGYWPYVSGANSARRVIGEGGSVPAPRGVGNEFGGLMLLQFGPVVYNSDPIYRGLFVAYGNDMVRRFGDPGFGRLREYEYFVDNSEEVDATIFLPRDTNLQRDYLVSMTAWVESGGFTRKVDLIDIPISVAPNAAGGYASYLLSTFVNAGLGTFVGVDYDSIRAARQFRQVAAFSAFPDPYEYKLLNGDLGLLLFKPTGFNYRERRPGGRTIPLVARVNYDVYDWRIIREDFRIPQFSPFKQKLILQNLVGKERLGPDQLQGADFQFNEPASNDVSNFLVIDTQTGSILLERSQLRAGIELITVDKSAGVVTFNDGDGIAANGLQGEIIDPLTSTVREVNMSGRSVRVLYRSKGEWSVQVMKAASRYQLAYGRPSAGQCYAGGSGGYYNAATIAGESPNRIYFPPMDDGQVVTVGEIWYDDGSGRVKSINDQNFLIRSTPADPTGLPYIDIEDIVPGAVLNYTAYHYAVKNVKGASLTVRALWNPTEFRLTADGIANLREFESWMQNYRRVSSTTFLVKESN